MEKRYRWILALVTGMFVFVGQAHATLALTIDNYTTDEITFTISGTFDADTIGGQQGWLALKNDWSNNQGVATQWFSVEPTVTLNTITIGGVPPIDTFVQNDSSPWNDTIFFENPLGRTVPIAAGTVVAGSVTLSAAGAFNPADIATLELISGFTDPDWVRLEAPELLPMAELTISKSGNVNPVVAGNELVYTIRVDNMGTGPAADVVVTDTLPAGVTLVSTSGCAEDPAAVPTCSLGTIDIDGFAEYTVTVTVDPSTTGVITNNVSVTTSSVESNPDNNSASQDTTVSAEADLSITKMDSSDPFVSGGNQVLVYTIEVSNAGPSDATNVVVTDILPSVALFESTSGCVNDPDGIPDCQLGTIAAGISASYTITVTLQRAAGTIINSASVISDAFDPDSENSSVSETTDITAISIPTLGVLGLAALILLLGSIGWVSIRRT